MLDEAQNGIRDAHSSRSAGNRLALASVVICLAFTYGVFFTGDLVSGDNIAQFHQTLHIIEQHRLSFSTQEVAEILRTYGDWGLNTRFSVNRDSTTYSQIYGPGQAVLALPLFALLRAARDAVGAIRPTDMTLWAVNWIAFATLLTMFTLDLCRVIGVARSWTVFITLAAAFASPIWMFASIPFNVVGETLATAAAMSLCLRVDVRRHRPATRRGTAIAAALAMVLIGGVFVRLFFATSIPAFAGWFVYSVATSNASLKERWRTICVFVVVFGLGALLLLAHNTHYFGSPFTTAYHDIPGSIIHFDGPWTVGFTGTFLNPLKSPLSFFPLVILLPAALAMLIRRGDPTGWFVILFLVPQVYLIPKYGTWDGGPDLFARYWLRLVPAVFLCMAVTLGRAQLRPFVNVSFRVVAVVLAALGFRAQLLTVMTDERRIYEIATAQIKAAHPVTTELEYRESIPRLLAGQTLVLRMQMAELTQPRQFLFVREAAIPVHRLWAVLAGIGATVFALARYTRLGRHTRTSAAK